MRREEREGTDFRSQMTCCGPSERQSIKSTRAAPDLIHQHETTRCRVVQDIRRFGHLDHEGGPAAREIIAGADTCEDPIDRADDRAFGGNMAADVSEQHNDRSLSHVSGFTAHVRSSNHQHAPVLVQHQIIGNKGILQHAFDDGMASCKKAQTGFRAEFWSRPLKFF